MSETNNMVMTPRERAHAQIDRCFPYSRPSTAQQQTMEVIRAAFIELAHELVDLTPPGREQSMMLTDLELAQRDAIAAVHHG